MFEADIFRLIPADTFYDFGKQVFPEMLKNNERLYAHVIDDYWNDIGTPVRYLQANIDFIHFAGKKSTRVEWRIKDAAQKLSFINPSALLEPGCQIGNFVVIGKNCKLAFDTYIEKSVLLPGYQTQENTKFIGVIAHPECLITLHDQLPAQK